MSNIEKIRQEIERLYDGEAPKHDQQCEFEDGYFTGIATISKFIDSLPEEKPSEDFPTSDEEMAKFLATHPKVEVPEKYKTPNWFFDKQPSEDKEEVAEKYADKHGFRVPYDGSNNYYDDVDVKASKEGFLAGAEWASPRWISVKEKLPPEDEEVIVLTNEANGHTLPIACHLCFAHIVSDKTMFVDYDGWNIPQVKYWMPCPELPEK